MNRRFAVVASIAGALLASWCGSAAATTNPQATINVACKNGNAYAMFSYSGFSPRWHLTAREGLQIAGVKGIGKTYLFDGPSGSETLMVRLPKTGGPYTISAQTQVFGGGGRLKASASRTVTCRRPPPPPPVMVAPNGWAQGPCGDPMYRFWLKAGSSRTLFTIRYNNFDSGWTSFTRTVARGGLVHTAYHHVRGLTRMTISARGHVLYSRVSAPGGNYRTCW